MTKKIKLPLVLDHNLFNSYLGDSSFDGIEYSKFSEEKAGLKLIGDISADPSNFVIVNEELFLLAVLKEFKL